MCFIMNEKALGVLEQYGLETIKSVRARGGIIVTTRDGIKLLYECNKSEGYYERESKITNSLEAAGFKYIDTYVQTLDGGLFAQDAQGRRYILKNWFDGRECDVKSVNDIIEAVRQLAKLHMKFDEMEKCEEILRYNNTSDLRMKFDKHTKEMRMVGNYLKSKKNKNDFEMLIRKSLVPFHEEALKAIELLEETDYGSRLEKARTSLELCHGNYNYHNVLLSDRGNAVINFDHCCVDCRITDLYQFMRKLLEKNDWDIKLGHMALEAYNSVYAIDETDRKILKVNFVYPEKFWKIINFYHSSNKSWIPRKSMEKLESVIAQNGMRQNFVQSLH